MPEFFQKLGDFTSGISAYFSDADGALTLLGSLILATLGLLTAFRCFQALRPALGEPRLGSVVGIGSAITAVFLGVGLYFLFLAGSRLL